MKAWSWGAFRPHPALSQFWERVLASEELVLTSEHEILGGRSASPPIPLPPEPPPTRRGSLPRERGETALKVRAEGASKDGGGGELVVRESADEQLVDRGQVRSGGATKGFESLSGEHDLGAAGIDLALLPPNQSALLHASEMM